MFGLGLLVAPNWETRESQWAGHRICSPSPASHHIRSAIMRKIAADSRALRHLAEELLDEIAESEEVPEGEWRDLATSLVRQWVSYDGNATLFAGGQHCLLSGPRRFGKI